MPASAAVSTTSRLPGLDHLRAAAILMVMVYHSGLFAHPPWVESVGGFGWTGVDLFFVLSGFLVGGQLFARLAAGRPMGLGEFWFKRVFRILPAYLAVLLLYYSLPFFKERGELPPLWRFLSFTQNFGLDLRSTSAFSHAWSLCVEEQFYLLLPALALLCAAWKPGRRLFWLAPALLLIGLVLRWWGWAHFVQPAIDSGQKGIWVHFYEWIYYPSYNRMDGLVLGVLLAALLHFEPALWRRLIRHGNAWLLAGLALLTAAWFLCEEQVSFGAAVFGYPLIDAGYALLVLAALCPGSLLARFESRFTAFVAAISYSLYLMHKQLIHLTQVAFADWGFQPDGTMVFAAGLLAGFAGGWLLYRLVERPLLRWRDRLLRRPAAGARAEAASAA